jgi:hypothetical protein
LTLIEVLISIAILAIGQVLIMQALARGAHALSVAERRSTAYAFAAAKLADINLRARQGEAIDMDGRFGSGRSAFEWRIDRFPQPDHPAIELLTLTIDWPQGKHRVASSFSAVRQLSEVEMLPQ